MASIESSSGADHRAAGQAEYSRVASSRHGGAVHVSGRKLRLTYFGVASGWGFLVGVGGTLAALQADNELSVLPGGATLGYVALSLVIAIGGSAIVAGAYQEAKRRR